jgi:hypothetical protein
MGSWYDEKTGKIYDTKEEMESAFQADCPGCKTESDPLSVTSTNAIGEVQNRGKWIV